MITSKTQALDVHLTLLAVTLFQAVLSRHAYLTTVIALASGIIVLLRYTCDLLFSDIDQLCITVFAGVIEVVGGARVVLAGDGAGGEGCLGVGKGLEAHKKK